MALKPESVAATATSGELALTAPSNSDGRIRVLYIQAHFSGTHSSENFTITKNDGTGATYDTTLYSVNLSTDDVRDIFWEPTTDLKIEDGDAIDVAFANTNNRTFGAKIVFEYI